MKKKRIVAILGALVLLFAWMGPAFARPYEPITKVKDWLYDNYYTDMYGFVELRNGWRLQDDPYQKDASLAEGRMQLDFSTDLKWGWLKLVGDLGYDFVEDKEIAGLRELNIAFSPVKFMDVKAGRQVLTWGTGDLLFINDLFPKDWKSFFIGRDTEYLKAPSDALKTSLFSDAVNVDLVYVPQFNNSNYIDGSRISYWNSLLGRTAGRDFVFADHERNSFARDSELAARLWKNIGSTETALYGYYGFWKTPEGVQPGATLTDYRLFYPRLAVAGGSLRTTVFEGIGNVEIGYYESLDDQSGDDPFVRNSEIRFLTGYEQEIGRNFTGAVQYYLEYMQDYDDYERTLPLTSRQKDEFRHVLTLRLTKMYLNQTLKLSLFVYFSPSDQDSYWRPQLNYKITDNWALDVGANIFAGSEDYTFFGQFEDATNAYVGLRYSF